MYDTDPTPEVSSLLDALGDGPVEEVTDELGETDEQATAEDSSADEQQQDETTEDASPAKVEFDGKTWELPAGTPPEVAEGIKKVADELKADYTRKQQVRADEERRVKADAQALTEFKQISQATHTKRVELEIVQRQIQQLESIDYRALVQTDPQQAILLQAEHSNLRSQLERGSAELNQLIHTEQGKFQEDKARRKAELIKAAPEVIPGFNAKVNQELLDTVTECGFSPEEVADITDPRLLKLINMARMGRQMQKSTPKALQKVAEAPKVIKPAAAPPKRENQAAAERLKKTGRATDLMSFL